MRERNYVFEGDNGRIWVYAGDGICFSTEQWLSLSGHMYREDGPLAGDGNIPGDMCLDKNNEIWVYDGEGWATHSGSAKKSDA
jgi:hypothetical protein